MELNILKDLSGKTPEEIAADGRFTEEEAKVISGAKIAVEQALELMKQKGVEDEALDISKEILVGNVSVETKTAEIPFGVVTTKLPFGTVYVGPSNFDGEPGIMEEVVIKNIATGEETVVSQVVVKAPVPAQQIAMEEDPNKINSIGNKPPFNHQSPFSHPSRPNFPGVYYAADSQNHLRPKGNLHPHQDHLRTEDDFMKDDQSDHKQFEGQGVTIEDILASMGDGRKIRFVPMHEELPGHPKKFSPEAFKNFLGLK